jgi:hypothetical protein
MLNKTSIYINSKDRNTGSINNFIYFLNYGASKNICYYIKNVTIPFSQYVSVYKTDDGTALVTFVAQNSSETHNITIAPGNYTATQIASLLETEFNSVFSTSQISVTYSVSTNKFTFTLVSGSPFQFYFVTNQAVGQELFRNLGFTPYLGTTGPGYVSSLTSINSIDIAGPPNYYIRSGALSVNSSYFSNQQSTTILQIPINVPPLSFICYENPVDDFIKLNKSNITTIDLQLTDEYGNLIDTNGLDYTINIVLGNYANV